MRGEPTERQLQILALRAEGRTQEEAARLAGIHRQTLLKEMQAFARDHGFKDVRTLVLVDFAIKKGWIEDPYPTMLFAGTLTDRQRSVIALVGEGLTDPEIGSRLYITANSVKTHLKAIFRRTDVKSRMQLAAFARQNGLLHE